jgi:hypothetical protein
LTVAPHPLWWSCRYRLLKAANNNLRPGAHKTIGVLEDLIAEEGCRELVHDGLATAELEVVKVFVGGGPTTEVACTRITKAGRPAIEGR